jgi:hypothetical protein
VSGPADVSAPTVPAFLLPGSVGRAAVDADLPRRWASWFDEELLEACAHLVGAGAAADGESIDWPTIRIQLDRGAGGLAGVAGLPGRERSLALHAALIGIGRGASREAFAYSQSRSLSGKSLIELDLLAARLSDVATHEMIADLQFGYLCEAAEGSEALTCQAEIRRSALRTVVEAAHVRGGHGFVQVGGAGKRVEAAQAIVLAAAIDGQGVG